MSYSNSSQYADQVEAVSKRLNNTIPPPQAPQTVSTTVVTKKKGFGLPAVPKLDPSFRRRYCIGRDACGVMVVTKLLAAKFGSAEVVAGVVSFQVVIPIGFALMIAGAAAGKPKWIEWGASVAIGASIGIWLFL